MNSQDRQVSLYCPKNDIIPYQEKTSQTKRNSWKNDNIYTRESNWSKYKDVFLKAVKAAKDEFTPICKVVAIPVISCLLCSYAIASLANPLFAFITFGLGVTLSCLYKKKWVELKECWDSLSTIKKTDLFFHSFIGILMIPASCAIIGAAWPVECTILLPAFIFTAMVYDFVGHRLKKKSRNDFGLDGENNFKSKRSYKFESEIWKRIAYMLWCELKNKQNNFEGENNYEFT